MNLTHSLQPKQSKIVSTETQIPLIIHGQGVFIFSTTASDKCIFTIQDESKANRLVVKIDATSFHIEQYKSEKKKVLKDPKNKCGLSKKQGAYYWVSLDSQNRKIYAGIGEPRLETMVYQYEYTTSEKQNKLFLETFTEADLSASNGFIQPMKILRDPISETIPMLVKPTDELTMTDIASSKYLPKSNLSLVSQKLYDCISGKNFCLDDTDFPDFTKAIEYSIATPGLWCNKTLEKKSKEFNKTKPNTKETYLRITLGQNNGESPGIPYVMEIWPKGHFSPIHNHGGSSAVIRVLHGKIDVHLYPYLCEEKPEKSVDPFTKVTIEKGDVTWISPTLNQIHQLKNPETNDSSCITIQCYMYDDENKTHYDYFDYLNSTGKSKQFEPDSDMDFISFKDLMKKEYSARL